MIKAIIFDCFGVLYVDASHDFYENQVPHYEKLRSALMELNKASDYGLITQDEWTRQVSETTGLPLVFVRQNIQRTNIRNKQLLEYTQQLRTRYKVGMLSNIGKGAMDQFFAAEERKELFDTVVLSSEIGLTKPHPEIFRLTAERLGVQPGECVMIDDLEENCSGADAAGMQAIHYRTNKQTIRDLAAILEEDKHA
ncbi:MAG TPA: HAD family phosphatase [Candidatus Saccharimonadales bacterium]